MKLTRYLFGIIAIAAARPACAQQNKVDIRPDNTAVVSTDKIAADSASQTDLKDIIFRILHKKDSPVKRRESRGATFSVVPYAGYTLSTGVTADISGNVGFYTGNNQLAHLSVITADVSYDSKNQKVLLTRGEIWADENNYKIVSDLRWERYPSDTYGLGSSTTPSTANDLDYYYLKVYETLLKKVADGFYAGIGYDLDCHYNIIAAGNADKSVSDFKKYGQTTSSTSSGIDFYFLYDTRKNSLNPLSGAFASLIYRQNATALGSSSNWQLFQLDMRKYIRLSATSNNIIALWALTAFSTGNAPYLDLPSTGYDMYNNSGRGYAIGRFRGKNMLYFEGEYRFGITHNGLLGGVLFANGQSFSGLHGNTFQNIAPAAGTGLRIKLNKHSNTNICIDYGIGEGGSHGFFVNLGEVF